MGAVRGYFEDRLKGRIGLSTLFWRDMVLIGSGVNVALMAMAFGYWGLVNEPVWIGMVIYFAAGPHNLFLTVSVLRTARRYSLVVRLAAQIASLGWSIVVTIA
jgi:hypothetical protein